MIERWTVRLALCLPAIAATQTPLPVDPAVTQSTIGETICAPGWSKAHRPPYAVTNAVKERLVTNAGLPPGAKRDFELDHRIPIDLGGLSTGDNLRLEAWPEAREKDAVEVCLAKAVCPAW